MPYLNVEYSDFRVMIANHVCLDILNTFFVCIIDELKTKELFCHSEIGCRY